MTAFYRSPQFQDAVNFFIYAFLELTVLFIGISFIVELIRQLLPPDKIKRFLSGNNPGSYLFAAVSGALTPFCSCSTIPMTTGFLRAGGGFGPVMTFLFVSPLLNPVLITLFILNFGVGKSCLYGSVALVMAGVSGLFMQKLQFNRFLIENSAPGTTPSPITTKFPEPVTVLQADQGEQKSCCASSCCVDTSNTRSSGSVKNIFLSAIKEFRGFLPYVVAGVAIGAIAHGFVPDGLLAKYAGESNCLAVPVAAVIGIPLYVRASTMIPISMSLLGKEMSVGAVMALVIGGAGASLPEVVMLKRLFRWPLLGAFLFEVFFMAVSTGYLFNLVG